MVKYNSLLLILTFIFLASCSSLNEKITLNGHNINKKVNVINIWSKRFDSKHQSGNLPISTTSAIINDTYVFASNQSGKFLAFNKKTGRRVWAKESKGLLTSAPSVIGKDVFYGTNSGRFYSRKQNNGSLNFEIDLGAGIATPAVFYKGRIFLHLNNHKIISLDQSTGKLLWAYTRSVPYTTTIQGASTPLIYNNSLIIGFSDGFLTSFRIDDGVLQWEKKIALNDKFVDIDITPIVLGRSLYIFSQDEELYQLNLSNGDIKKKFEVFPSSYIKNGKSLVIGTKFGNLKVLKNSKFELNKKISNAGINNILKLKKGYFLTDLSGYLYFLDNNYNEVWKRYLGHSYSTNLAAPYSHGDYVAVYSSRENLYLYQIK